MADDLVYLVRPGNRNEELRWSLRSVEVNMPGRRVWIVGHKPDWLTGVEHIPTRQEGHKHQNTLANLAAACEHEEVSEKFVLFNDDFFVLRPLGEVPVLHRGTLNEFIERYRRPHVGAELGWWRRAVETRKSLAMLGHDPDMALSYELHVPLPMCRETWLAGVKELQRIGRYGIRYWTKRSFYGNFAGLGGRRCDDVKIADDKAWERAGAAAGVTGWTFLSTADGAFKYGRVGRWLRGKFPDRCRFERRGP